MNAELAPVSDSPWSHAEFEARLQALGSRYHIHQTLPLPARDCYMVCYGSALSLLAGRGFQRLPLPESVPECAPVRKFLQLQQDRLSARDWEAYCAASARRS